ncbi:hypothetical protein HAX54_047321, partial [Datura stramonium]|nr:hypothetical protein [Datura stramonium]
VMEMAKTVGKSDEPSTTHRHLGQYFPSLLLKGVAAADGDHRKAMAESPNCRAAEWFRGLNGSPPSLSPMQPNTAVGSKVSSKQEQGSCQLLKFKLLVKGFLLQ